MENNRQLLVVDDKRTNRRLIREIFKTDFDVLEAENGRAALSTLHESSSSVRVIILDLVMPVMDGFSFLEAKLNDPGLRDIPVLVITESNNDANEERALDLGADDFITRPFNSRIVKRRVDKVLFGAENSPETQHLHPLHTEIYDFLNQGMSGGVTVRAIAPGLPARYVSASLARLLGYDGANAMQAAWKHQFANAIDPADRARVVDALMALDVKQSTYSLEYRLMRRDGERVWVRDSGIVTRTPNAPATINGVCVDMTEVHRAMSDLRVFEAAFTMAQEQNSDIIARFNVQERTMFLPPWAAYELGIPTKVTNFPLSLMEKGVVSDESLASILHLFTDMQNGSPTGEGKLDLRTRSGEFVPYAYKYSIVYSAPSNAVLTLRRLSKQ